MSKALILLLISTILISCTRAGKNDSKVSIQTPSRNELVKSKLVNNLSLIAGKKVCFGVSATGPGIGSVSSCGVEMGVLGEFVQEGGSISLDVPRGADRVISLIAYITEENQSCPSWGELSANASLWKNAYKAGSLGGVLLNSDSQTFDLAVSISDTSIGISSGVGECSGLNNKVHAILYSSGDVVKANNEKFTTDYSSPILEGFSFVEVANYLWTLISSSGSGLLVDSVAQKTEVIVPPYIRSVTQKPDSPGVYFGLQEDGQIVQLDVSNGTVMPSFTCPFATCQVPVWLQSISAGKGDKIYGLDHGGNLYDIQVSLGSLNMVLEEKFSPAVNQVSYY